MEELGEKRDLSDLRPVESKTKFRIFGIKNGKLAKGAIITVPPEVVSKLSPEQKASLTAAVEAVTETVVDNTKAEKDAEAKKGKGEKKFNKKLLLIIPCIAMVLPMVMKSCDGRLLKSIDDRTTTPTATASESVKEEAVKQIPLGSFGKTEDIANMAVFLASDKAGYITGQVIHVDGGMAI